MPFLVWTLIVGLILFLNGLRVFVGWMFLLFVGWMFLLSRLRFNASSFLEEKNKKSHYIFSHFSSLVLNYRHYIFFYYAQFHDLEQLGGVLGLSWLL